MRSPRLAKGIIKSLKDYGKLNVPEIADSIGWTPTQVVNEIRRLKDTTILGIWITETKTPVKGKCYELDKTFRNGATVDCMYDMALKTFKFNTPIQERI